MVVVGLPVVSFGGVDASHDCPNSKNLFVGAIGHGQIAAGETHCYRLVAFTKVLYTLVAHGHGNLGLRVFDAAHFDMGCSPPNVYGDRNVDSCVADAPSDFPVHVIWVYWEDDWLSCSSLGCTDYVLTAAPAGV
jgi:hypothetical protein